MAATIVLASLDDCHHRRNGAPFKDRVMPAAMERVRRKLAGASAQAASTAGSPSLSTAVRMSTICAYADRIVIRQDGRTVAEGFISSGFHTLGAAPHLNKKHHSPCVPVSLIVRLGGVTEPLNRHWFERTTDQVLTAALRRVRHPAVRYLAAMLDAMVEATETAVAAPTAR